MVAARVNLGIQRRDELHKIPLTQVVRDAHERYRLDRQWMALAQTTQQETDAEMCRVAEKLSRQDIKKHPTGGALMVETTRPMQRIWCHA